MLLWSYKIVPMDGAPYKFAKKTGRGWEWGGEGVGGGGGGGRGGWEGGGGEK